MGFLLKARMLLVLSEEHKEHLSFLTKVDVDGEPLYHHLLVTKQASFLVVCVGMCVQLLGSSAGYQWSSLGRGPTLESTNLQLVSGHFTNMNWVDCHLHACHCC